ncbi:MAG: hypothetical protein HY268_31150 [Deltaproteobacteria bacterium]|nr:hypothetical protein [Deltaproteobacteria bacterium]
MSTHRVEATLTQDGTLTLSHLPFHAGDAVEVIIVARPTKSTSAVEKEKLSRTGQTSERSRKKLAPFTVKGSLKLCGSPEELEEALRRIRRRWAEATQRSSTELARELART